MKYKIEITGGFTGIPKSYEGELPLKGAEKKELLRTLRSPSVGNEALRDGQHYSLSFEDGDKTYAAAFAEHSLPRELRELIDRLIVSG
ncbi:protealysin inhibitor emfourin [Pseudozobellia thermophila]|uniref:Uncharacterized protein n=1 Tax=Pseudozobellia thermophila TaxID=192903 RepID=A0A1M6EPW7_9FLAO|nr:protealysin inhibitor emfourin [Pseudozobellia thermophila]SHI87398.1 hypothetical protein SAMN04488513_102134 [Pseudozobellia thermophila]